MFRSNFGPAIGAAFFYAVALHGACYGQVPGEPVAATSEQATVNLGELPDQTFGDPTSALEPTQDSFPGIVGRFLPPVADTNGAVGPAHLMTVLNHNIKVQSKSGEELKTIASRDFWAPVEEVDGVSPGDPRVAYDPFADRWILTAFAGNTKPRFYLAVSSTGDPTGEWHLHRIDMKHENPDFPRLGFNSKWIAVQVSAQNPNRSQHLIYAFDKAELYNGGKGKHTFFDPPSEFGFGPVPAWCYDRDEDRLYLVSTYGEGLRLYSLEGDLGAETLSIMTDVESATKWTSAVPGDIGIGPQKGTDYKVNLDDSRICNVVVRNGYIWTTHTIFLPAADPTRAAVQWWQLKPDGTIVQQGQVDDPSGETMYAFPSIAVNKRNEVLLGYNRFSADQYPSANYSYRLADDNESTLRGDTVYKAGENYYEPRPGSGVRWGDYSGTAVDPENDVDMWTIQQYSAEHFTIANSAITYMYGTWWKRFDPGTQQFEDKNLVYKVDRFRVRHFGNGRSGPENLRALIYLYGDEHETGVVGTIGFYIDSTFTQYPDHVDNTGRPRGNMPLSQLSSVLNTLSESETLHIHWSSLWKQTWLDTSGDRTTEDPEGSP